MHHSLTNLLKNKLTRGRAIREKKANKNKLILA